MAGAGLGLGFTEFLALQCFSCSTFIVQQRTKGKRWACRRCGVAQSYMRVFFASASAAQARAAVMQLNAKRGERADAEAQAEAARREAREAREAEREAEREAAAGAAVYAAAYSAATPRACSTWCAPSCSCWP